MWSFGDGENGKLGLGSSNTVSTPQVIESLQDIGIDKVCCGTQFSVFLTTDGVSNYSRSPIYAYNHEMI